MEIDKSCQKLTKLTKVAQNCTKLHRNARKWRKVAQNCTKLHRNAGKWRKVAQNCRKLRKIARNGRKIAGNGARLRKIAGNGARLRKIAGNGARLRKIAGRLRKIARNGRKIAGNGAKLPKLACQLCIMLRNLCQFCQFLATFVNFHCDMGPSLDTCYAGKHEKCEKNSLVCSSRNSYSFPYLPFTFKGQVKMTPSDIANIEQAVHDRLNEHILEHSRFSTTSQKAECVFSALKSCNPKHSVTYSRNAGNRDHSAIHIINNGPGVSLVKKLEAMRVPPNRSEKSSSLRALYQMQRRRNLDICRKQKSISARRRTARRRQLYALHKDLKGLSNYKSNPEHNYCKKETI